MVTADPKLFTVNGKPATHAEYLGSLVGRLTAQVTRVRELHSPERFLGDNNETRVVCGSCPWPSWPCPTARCVFSIQEVAEAAAFLGGRPDTSEAGSGRERGRGAGA